MKKYTFKDGTKVIASSVEDAKAKHKVMAAKKVDKYKDEDDEVDNILKSAGLDGILDFWCSVTGHVDLEFKDSFNNIGIFDGIDYRSIEDQNTLGFKSIKSLKSYVSKNKDKLKEFVEYAKKLNKLAKEIGLV